MGRWLALLIATYEYEDAGLRRLITPAHDAEAFAEVLGDPSIAGFEVTTLVNEPLHQVGRAIGTFYRGCRRDDVTLLYFTGHGLKDDEGRLYLAMTNTLRDDLLFTGLPAEHVDKAMEGCASRHKILVLDCCYSGAFPAGRITKADTAVHTLERFQGRGRTVLTASDATQYSFEGDRPHGRAAQSVFTRYLVEGLRDGSADLDGDGDITVDELYSYAHDRVVEEMPQQRPKKQEDVQGRTVIARNVNWSLPTYLSNALASPIATDRLNALEALSRLHRVGNDVVRARAEQEIRRLADDDSRQVSTAATALLTDHPIPTTGSVDTTAEPPPATTPHPLSPVEPPPSATTPPTAEPPAPPPAPSTAPPASQPTTLRTHPIEPAPHPAQPPPQPTEPAMSPTGPASHPKSNPSEPPPEPIKPAPQPADAASRLTGSAPQPTRLERHRTGFSFRPTRIGFRHALASRRVRLLALLATAVLATAVVWLTWDRTESTEGGSSVETTPVIAGAVERIMLSPDAKTLAGFTTAGGVERVHLWDVPTRREIDNVGADASSFAFSSDPNTLAFGVEGGAAVLWDRTRHLTKANLRGTESGPALAFSPDGRTVATAATCACPAPFDNPVLLWNTADGGQKAALPGHTNGVQHMTFSRDGRLLLTGAVDRTVRVWDVATGKNTVTLDAGHIAAFSPDATLIAASSHYTEKVSLWDTATGQRVRLLDAAGEPVSFSTDGKTLATTGFDRKVAQLWDVATGKLLNTGTPDGPWTISPDHRTVAIGAPDNSVLLIDPATGGTKGRLTGHTARVSDVTYSADGRTLVSAGADGTIRLWPG
ncbi:caspase, EACC1-associated type [Saccharothrix sp. NRRL B-16314]|uniref:caspase, EACC1-associated type n=1 Tax=Saccharothrix sp. NRRL B-16314 TaxID=1463825 RepID=UPI00068F31BD|nr:caspase family protein [Saccharothrix sp. NRRL B-16314]